MNEDVLLVGCGEMGGAMLSRWVSTGWPGRIVVVSRGRGGDAFAGLDRVRMCRDASGIPADFSPAVVVLAVMTHSMAEAIPDHGRHARTGAVYLSIAAGLGFEFFAERLGGDAAVVRAMPNTPAAIGRGVSLAVPNDATTERQRALCERLLEAVGEVVWTRDEEHLAPATALSGAGPAYVFLLIECLARAGERCGLPPDVAATLARLTVAGAGEFAGRRPERTSELIRNVARPGGVTERALEVLDGPCGIGPIFEEAMRAATQRAREMSRFE